MILTLGVQRLPARQSGAGEIVVLCVHQVLRDRNHRAGPSRTGTGTSNGTSSNSVVVLTGRVIGMGGSPPYLSRWEVTGSLSFSFFLFFFFSFSSAPR